MISVCVQTYGSLSCVSLPVFILVVCSVSAVILLSVAWFWLNVAMPR